MRYKATTQELQLSPEKESSHWLYSIVPRHRTQIKPIDAGHWLAWGLFGNDDDGLFGEGPQAHYKLHENPSFKKALFWTCRNPLHNFTFYVIGSAERENSEITFMNLSCEKTEFFTYKPVGNTTFGSKGSSFYLGLHGLKPFTSLRIAYSKKWQSEFYFGWRHRGNFGIKLNLLKKRKAISQSNVLAFPEEA